MATTTSSSGKKPRAEAKFNFSIINELRSIICAETFLMIGQQSMKVPQQASACDKIYHGDNDKEVMGQAAKFMKGMEVYGNIWMNEQTKFGPQIVLLERLHQQPGKVLVAGDNISEDLIWRTYATKPQYLTGLTIIAKAKEAIAGAKKIAALLPEAIKEHVLERAPGGEYSFPSGRSEDDFDQWMLKRLFNWKKYYGPSGADDSTPVGEYDDTSNKNDIVGGGDDESNKMDNCGLAEVSDGAIDGVIDDDITVGKMIPRKVFPDKVGGDEDALLISSFSCDGDDDKIEEEDADPPADFYQRDGFFSRPVVQCRNQ